jgi:hypothetical protein
VPLGFISDEQIRARLEELGVSQVRTLNATGGLPTTWNLKVAKWLAEKEEEEQRKRDAFQAEQARVNLSMKRAAWAAFYTGCVGIIVALVVWKWSHLWGG